MIDLFKYISNIEMRSIFEEVLKSDISNKDIVEKHKAYLQKSGNIENSKYKYTVLECESKLPVVIRNKSTEYVYIPDYITSHFYFSIIRNLVFDKQKDKKLVNKCLIFLIYYYNFLKGNTNNINDLKYKVKNSLRELISRIVSNENKLYKKENTKEAVVGINKMISIENILTDNDYSLNLR